MMSTSRLAFRRAARVALASLPLLVTGPLAAAEAGSFSEAIVAGKAGVNVRARYERVDQDAVAENADALTARLRLNYRTGSWKGLSALAEYDYVFHLLSDFNSGGGTSPQKSAFPVVADPKGADLNQLYLDYSFNDSNSLRIGRQRILLDNQRFVGGVGWRQNEQTYDGLTFTSRALGGAEIRYSYVTQVRRIFGERVAAGRNDVDAHLLNVRIDVSDNWSVTPYYYRIDNDDVAVFSTATLGGRFAGKVAAGQSSVSLVAEFARQEEIANNPVAYGANYTLLSGEWQDGDGLSLGIAYESLGGDASQPGRMFRTPLATLHAFQGWADQFLTTPDTGIDDIFVTARYTAGDWKLVAVYHDFSAADGGTDFGTELDVSAARKLSKQFDLPLKGAHFSSDSAAFPDTTKFWLMLTANFE